MAEIELAQERSRRIAVFMLLSDMSRRRDDWLAHFLFAMKTKMGDVYRDMIDAVEPRLDKAGLLKYYHNETYFGLFI